MAAPKEMTTAQPVCRKHKAPLSLYCVEMEELACEQCKVASGHKEYRFWTVEKAAETTRVVPSSSLEILAKKVKGHEEAQRVFSDMAKHLKIQAQQTGREIKDEFEKLHRFLREEEEDRITALKEEEKQKNRTLKERIESITKELSFVSDTIKTIERGLEADNISFLQNYKTTLDRTWLSLQDQQSQPVGFDFFVRKLAQLRKTPCKVHDDTAERLSKPYQEPEPITGGLINAAEHLGNLKYSVWKKMLGTVQYTPVTLDPNTAAPCLSLSEELTSIQFCTDNPQLPDNPERLSFGAQILGSKGFTSGRHCWEVQVGDNTNWAVGVATQSIEREEDNFQSQLLEILALCCSNGHYTTRMGPVPVWQKPRRVRVELDWNSKSVTFSDPANYGSITTMAFHFTERVFPYFCSSCEEHPLQITPEEVSISVEAPKQVQPSGLLNFFLWKSE